MWTAFEGPIVRQHVGLRVSKQQERGQGVEYQVVLTEMELAGLGGLGLMRAIHASRPHTSVLFMTSDANVLPLLLGSRAFGYVRKPIDAGYCIAAIRHAAQDHQREATISLLKNTVEQLYS